MAKCVKAVHWSWAVIAMIVIAATCGSTWASTPVPALIETPKSSATATGATGVDQNTMPHSHALTQPVVTPASAVSTSTSATSGGNLIMSVVDGVYGWDPKSPFHSVNIQVVGQLYNQIVQYDTRDTGRVICDLCESWTVSDEGKTFTFRIRPGIKWLDGQDLTAEDVHHSMLRYGDLTSSAGLSGYWRNYTLVANDGGVNHVDNHSVQFNLPSFSGAFIKSLALDYVKVLPKHLLEQGIDLNSPGNIMEHRSGSGPFVLESYREGARYKVSKNQDYFKEGRPYLDSIEHFVINEPSTVVAALLTSAIDMTSGFPGLRVLSPSQALEVESATSTTTTALGWWFQPDFTAGGAASLMGVAGPLVALLGFFQPPQQLLGPEPFLGQHLTHHPVHLGAGDLRHLFPPNPAASPAGRPRPAGTW